MIHVQRSLARQFRAVLRKSVLAGSARSSPCHVVFRAGTDGLRIQAQGPTAGLEYHDPGAHDSEVVAIPVHALADFEGKGEGLVELSSDANGSLASWKDGVVPRTRRYENVALNDLPRMPTVPETMTELPPSFIEAMREAAATASTSRVRYAVDCIQLRGHDGKIIATDGRHLLVQSGFPLPWPDLLVPALPVFGCRDLPLDQPVQVGKSDNFLTMRMEPWTLHLAIDKDSRYPNVESIIPKASSTTIHLAQQDAEFLGKTLSSLPGNDEEYAPITLDVNGQVVVRARGEEQQQPTEVVLCHSTASGRAVRLTMNRRYLARALHLGFSEIRIGDPAMPVLCDSENRNYVWQGLPTEGAVRESPNALRILSDETNPRVTEPKRERKRSPMANDHAQANGVHESDSKTNGSGINALITEVETLKAQLRECYGRANQIGVAIKRQRKQAQVVQSTLLQLRQLQQVGA
ncbi:MAG: hypothetical protein FJ271_33290 [Planctomycetes bacterium]|nr:hypothetical protein [Planctomycetota bacterium]